MMARFCGIWILSSLQLKWLAFFLCQSQNFLDLRLQREREREREREQLINGITNERTNIGKDERTNGKTKTIHPSA